MWDGIFGVVLFSGSEFLSVVSTTLIPLIGDIEWLLPIGEMGLSMPFIGEPICFLSPSPLGDLPLGVYTLGAIGSLGGDIICVCVYSLGAMGSLSGDLMFVFLGVPAGEDDGECLFFGGEFDLSILLLYVSLLPLSLPLSLHLLPPSSACILLLSSCAFFASF